MYHNTRRCWFERLFHSALVFNQTKAGKDNHCDPAGHNSMLNLPKKPFLDKYFASCRLKTLSNQANKPSTAGLLSSVEDTSGINFQGKWLHGSHRLFSRLQLQFAAAETRHPGGHADLHMLTFRTLACKWISPCSSLEHCSVSVESERETQVKDVTVTKLKNKLAGFVKIVLECILR